jgi:hypothetical protein
LPADPARRRYLCPAAFDSHSWRTFESEWSPALGESLINALKTDNPESRLDIGCVAAHGMFTCDEKECHAISPQGKPATAFLLELIARLQNLGTVPMLDTRAYARWLAS